MSKMAELSGKQKRFTEEYLIDLNATQSAIRAGFSPKTTRQQGQRMLTNVDIQKAITQSKSARSKRVGIHLDRVIQELTAVAFFDIRKVMKLDGGKVTFFDSQTWSDETAASIAAVTQVFDREGNYIGVESSSMTGSQC